MNLTAILSALLLVGCLTGGAYWQGRKDGRDVQLSEAARDAEVAAIASEAAASAVAEGIAAMKVKQITIRQELQREVQTRVEYRDCRHSPDGLRQLNAALAGTTPASAARGVVSAASAAKR
jgi:hypothetical protein